MLAAAMSVSPWSDAAEWDDVFEMLYSSQTDSNREGLARVGGVR